MPRSYRARPRRGGAPPATAWSAGCFGDGSQRVVCLVHDEVLARDCALWMIKPELLEPDDLERLRREAQAMASLGDLSVRFDPDSLAHG